jgi:hypothetical protein
VTASAGIARLLHGETLEHVLRRADSALYEAKLAGRNRKRALHSHPAAAASPRGTRSPGADAADLMPPAAFDTGTRRTCTGTAARMAVRQPAQVGTLVASAMDRACASRQRRGGASADGSVRTMPSTPTQGCDRFGTFASPVLEAAQPQWLMIHTSSQDRRETSPPAPASVPPRMPALAGGRSARRRPSALRTPALIGAATFVGGAVLVVNDGTASNGAASWLESFPLALIGLGATLAYLAVFVVLHILDIDYDPIRNAVSDYGVGRYGFLFRAGLFASSVGVLALAVAVGRSVGTPPVDARYLGYLLLIPIARLGMSIFPTTVEGRHLTRTARAHYVCAIAAFALTYLVISDLTPVLRHLGPDTWTSGPLRLCAAAVGPELIAVVLTMIGPLRRVFGLVERVFLLTTNVWFVLLALLLIGRST